MVHPKIRYILDFQKEWNLGHGSFMVFNSTFRERDVFLPYEENYKKRAMIAAKELCYDNEVIEKIKVSKSIAEVERVMNTARKNMIY